MGKPSRPKQVAPQRKEGTGAFLVFQGPVVLGAISVPSRRSLGKREVYSSLDPQRTVDWSIRSQLPNYEVREKMWDR